MKAELIDYMGDDLRVVNAARVSFNKESEIDCFTGDVTEKDKKLITYLANHGHWTPFSHPMITVRETVPIFVARQRFKHMVGFTYNEVSRRYVDDPPEFYVPDEWRGKPKNAKQGSSDEVIKVLEHQVMEATFGKGTELVTEYRTIESEYKKVLETAQFVYDLMIKNGVAPEQARMVLPQSMYTSYYTTGSLAAWSRAYKQRIDSHSQAEIRDLATQWDTIIQPLFPVSWEALTKNE